MSRKHHYTVGMFSFVLIAVILGCGPSETRAQTGPPGFLQWIGEQAIHLDQSNWMDTDLSLLSRLDALIEGKRFIFVGEPDHYIQEKLDCHLLLIRYLFEKGYDYLGMEGGVVQGRLIDRFLETGDSSELVGFGDLRNQARPDRDDRFPLLRAALESPIIERASIESHQMMSRLLSISRSTSDPSRRLHTFGFDVEPIPNLCYEEIRIVLKSFRDSREVRDLLESLTLVENETRLEERNRIERLLAGIRGEADVWRTHLGRDRFSELEHLLIVLIDSLTSADNALSDPGSWLPNREAKIWLCLQRQIEMLPPDAKVILVAHNIHLAKRSDRIAVDGHVIWEMIGTRVNRAHPGEVFSFWMLYDSGRHARMMGGNPIELRIEDVESDPDRIEHILAEAGSVFLLPIHSDDARSAYLDRQVNFVMNGRSARAVLREQTDAIFFVAEVSLLGGPP
jgi:hypothetical protein